VDSRELFRDRLWPNISGLGLPEQTKIDMLEIAVAKCAAETEEGVSLNTIPNDATMWAIMRLPNRTLEQKRALLDEEAGALLHAALQEAQAKDEDDDVGPVSSEEEYTAKRLALLKARNALGQRIRGDEIPDEVKAAGPGAVARFAGVVRRVYRTLTQQ
jgi:hypothetical protein